MKTFSMYGASDDLIEASGVRGAKEFYSLEDGTYHGSFNLGGKMRIHAIYDGCWSFAVGQIDEEIPLPDWPIRIGRTPECAYSTLLEIDVPDDAKLFQEKV